MGQTTMEVHHLRWDPSCQGVPFENTQNISELWDDAKIGRTDPSLKIKTTNAQQYQAHSWNRLVAVRVVDWLIQCWDLQREYNMI